MFDVLVRELSDRYGLGDRSRDLFGLLMGYIYNDRRGGFGGFAESFRQQGHGDLFASWLGGETRTQRALSISEVGMVFGQGLLSDWGSRIGVSRATVAAAIAGILPRLIGELTPGGRMPDAFGSVAPVRGGTNLDQDADDAHTAAATPTALFDDRAAVAGLRREERDRVAGAFGENVAPLSRQAGNYPGDPLRRDGGRIEPGAAAMPIDPHVAAITAAVAAPEAPLFAEGDALRDFDFRRPQPIRKRGGFGWMLWLLILLALGVGGWYYWQEFHPLKGVQLPWSTEPATS